MLALRCTELGEIDSMALEEVRRPSPQAGEVLVRVVAASVNYSDTLITGGKYQVSVPVPFIVGSEFAGIVEEVAPGIESISPGDHVMGTVMTGAFAEWLNTVSPSTAAPSLSPPKRFAAPAASRMAAVVWGVIIQSVRPFREHAGKHRNSQRRRIARRRNKADRTSNSS